MTLSGKNFQRCPVFSTLVLAAALALPAAHAAAPPDAELAAAGAAIAAAERLKPVGGPAQFLERARSHLAQAQQLAAKRKFRDALILAQAAQAEASLAQARARQMQAQQDVDEKTARNADLRRQLLVLPEGGQ